MNKIQYVSRLFKWLFILCIILLPILSLLFWWLMPPNIILHYSGITQTYTSNNTIILHSLSPMTRFYAFLSGMIPLAVNLYMLYFLIKLFRLFQACRVFTAESAIYIKYIGYTLLVGPLLHPLYRMLLTYVLTWHNPAGHRIIAIGFSGTNIALLLAAALIILVSWIMSAAQLMQQEQQYTI